MLLKPTKAMDVKLADIYKRLGDFKDANIERLSTDDKAFVTASRREIARLRKALTTRASSVGKD